MKWIKNFERRYIPNLRRRKWFKIAKVFILAPIILPLYGIKVGFLWVASKIRIKRKTKPDIILKNIILGWTNLILPNQASETEAKLRAESCAHCEHAILSPGIYRIVVDNRTAEVRGMYCELCGCPLSAKVRSKDDYCPNNPPRW
jgi:hypothetical protein